MRKSVQISIPAPCHENWDAMTTEDKGRFCASCQKSVLDFTKSSDREIASVLKDTENICGRFSVNQINRDLIIPKEKSSVWIAASATIVSFLTIGNQTLSAQTPANTEQHLPRNREIMGKIAAPQHQIIKGTVSDNTTVLAGAYIAIKGTDKTTQTDFDGKFSIEANDGDTLQVSYEGKIAKEIFITKKSEYNITLEEDTKVYDVIIMGAIASPNNRTFMGRIFHSIGSIFG